MPDTLIAVCADRGIPCRGAAGMTSGAAPPRQWGFTLIELLIVVAVVAILAAVAYPSYQESLERARRADAKDALLGARLAQEKFRANCPQYATTMGAADNCDPPTDTYQMNYAPGSPDGHYTVAIVAGSVSATGYTMTATPVVGGAQVGDDCGTFALNENGEDTSGTYADARCWDR